ncbi:unnamed protein product [Prunus armeniaca]
MGVDVHHNPPGLWFDGDSFLWMTLPTVQTSDDCCDLEDNHIMLFLQGIVDHEMRFLDIVTGWPGGMTVSRLLMRSGFFKLCEGGQRLNENFRTLSGVEIREYLVGGLAILCLRGS